MARKVIALLGQPIINEDGVAGSALVPGMLVSGVSTINVHAAAAANCARAFALERDELGKGIDTAYAIGDTVKVGVFHGGQRVYAFIASGQNIAEGGLLESAGDGTLAANSAGVVLARALEAVNNSAGPGNARIRAEII
jgi:hypothetical protein